MNQFLEGTPGVKRTTMNWAVLREGEHKLLQLFWFRSVVKLFNSMLKLNSETLIRVLKANLSIHTRDPSCRTGIRCFSRALDTFQGLRRCDSFVQGYFHFYSKVH